MGKLCAFGCIGILVYERILSQFDSSPLHLHGMSKVASFWLVEKGFVLNGFFDY